jgi:hypothetical protein
MPLGLGLMMGLGHNVAASGGGGGGSSSISTIAGADLLMELDASTLTGTNGDQISTWTDASGHSNSVTGTGAGSKPTLDTAGRNGHNVVNFNGAVIERFTVPTTLFGAATEGSLVVIRKAATSGANGAFFNSFGTDAANDEMPFSDGLWYTDALSTVRKDAIAITADTNWHIQVIRSKGGRWTIDIDGVNYLDTATPAYRAEAIRYCPTSD